eukprot:7180720-Alexandrium_andersonii.AAC.1
MRQLSCKRLSEVPCHAAPGSLRSAHGALGEKAAEADGGGRGQEEARRRRQGRWRRHLGQDRNQRPAEEVTGGGEASDGLQGHREDPGGEGHRTEGQQRPGGVGGREEGEGEALAYRPGRGLVGQAAQGHGGWAGLAGEGLARVRALRGELQEQARGPRSSAGARRAASPRRPRLLSRSARRSSWRRRRPRAIALA